MGSSVSGGVRGCPECPGVNPWGVPECPGVSGGEPWGVRGCQGVSGSRRWIWRRSFGDLLWNYHIPMHGSITFSFILITMSNHIRDML